MVSEGWEIVGLAERFNGMGSGWRRRWGRQVDELAGVESRPRLDLMIVTVISEMLVST
jgi:hypothetical protein